MLRRGYEAGGGVAEAWIGVSTGVAALAPELREAENVGWES